VTGFHGHAARVGHEIDGCHRGEHHGECDDERQDPVCPIGANRHRHKSDPQGYGKAGLMATEMHGEIATGGDHLGEMPHDEKDTGPSERNPKSSIASGMNRRERAPWRIPDGREDVSPDEVAQPARPGGAFLAPGHVRVERASFAGVELLVDRCGGENPRFVTLHVHPVVPARILVPDLEDCTTWTN
jgi:hypothetical protein